MKAKLTFKLPKDKYEYEMAIKGKAWHNVAWEMFQYLRGKIKYAPDDVDKQYTEAMADCKEELFRIMNDNGVDLEV